MKKNSIAGTNSRNCFEMAVVLIKFLKSNYRISNYDFQIDNLTILQGNRIFSKDISSMISKFKKK